jgi:hypothetical protein
MAAAATDSVVQRDLTVTEHIQVFNNFFNKVESKTLFDSLLSNDIIPWGERTYMLVYKLPQLGFKYSPTERKKKPIPVLETLCSRLEIAFECKIDHVWLNLFRNPEHHIDWHQDQYGSGILVATLGSTRCVEFRHNETKKVTTLRPPVGSVYFMSPRHDADYHHRVLAYQTESDSESESDVADGTSTSTKSSPTPRISLVFFCSPPQSNPAFSADPHAKLQRDHFS